jgi:hypothetical protein
MGKNEIYRTNRIPALVITLLGIALIFTNDIDRLLVIYRDPWGLFFVTFFCIVNPLLLLFGFSFKISGDEIVGQSYFVFAKRFKIGDLSHILYQPTWRGVTSMNSSTTMRSLHIVRHSGGWKDTISLTNGPFREEDLADIAKRLQRMNPRIEFDEHAQALIKRY